MFKFANTFMILLTAGSQDIFNSDYTQGNLYEIQPITNFLGQIAVWVISAIGFGIVIFSILKNAISGLYVINPNLWDKVDEAKKSAVEKGNNLGGNVIVQKMGSISVMFLKMLPNVRELTDFAVKDGEGGDTKGLPDKKEYFIKSLPLCVAQIFIGMFIFLGYPSQIANWIGSAGTEVIDMLIGNIDPVQTVTGLSTKLANVKFSTDGSNNTYDININKAAKAAYQVASSRASDMEKQSRQEVAFSIENWLSEAMQGADSYIGADDGWDVVVQATLATSEPKYSANWNNHDKYYSSIASDGRVTLRTHKKLDELVVGQMSTKVTANDYIMVTFQATPVALTQLSSSSATLTGYVGSPQVQKGKSCILKVTTVSYSSNGVNSSLGVYGTPGGACTAQFYDNSGELVKTYDGSVEVLGSQLQLAFTGSIADDIGKMVNEKTASYVTVTFANTNKLKIGAQTPSSSLELNVTGLSLTVNGAVSSNFASGVILSSQPIADYVKLAGKEGAAAEDIVPITTLDNLQKYIKNGTLASTP